MTDVVNGVRYDASGIHEAEHADYLKENQKRNFWLLLVSWLLMSSANLTTYSMMSGYMTVELFGGRSYTNELMNVLRVAGLTVAVLYGAGKLQKTQYLVKPLISYGKVMIAASLAATIILLFFPASRMTVFVVVGISIFLYIIHGLFNLAYLLITAKTIFTADRGKLFGYRYALLFPAGLILLYPLQYIAKLVFSGMFGEDGLGYGYMRESIVIFMSCVFILWLINLQLLRQVREIPAPTAEAEGGKSTGGSLWVVIRQERNFAWFVVLRSIAYASLAVIAFHNSYAVSTIAMPSVSNMSWYSGTVYYSKSAGYIVMGMVAAASMNRLGPIKALRLSLLAAGAGMLLIPLARSLTHLAVIVAVVFGFETASVISTAIAQLEFGRPENRAFYIGIMLIVFAVVTEASKIILLGLDLKPGMFLVAGAVTIIVALLLGLKVREPREVAEYQQLSRQNIAE